MGKDIRPNLGLDYRILHILLENIEEEMADRKLGWVWKCFLLVFGFYMIARFTVSLRGNKEFMIELQGLIQHGSKGVDEKPKLKYIAISLLREFK
eukprot:7368229-Ditylum_brightwellii.AAC.1